MGNEIFKVGGVLLATDGIYYRDTNIYVAYMRDGSIVFFFSPERISTEFNIFLTADDNDNDYNNKHLSSSHPVHFSYIVFSNSTPSRAFY